MRTTRTLTTLALAAALAGGLTACGENDADTGLDTGGIEAESTPSSASGESGAPTAAASAEPSALATSSPTTATPATTPTPAAGTTVAPAVPSAAASPTG